MKAIQMNAALIAYFPSLSSLKKLFPEKDLSFSQARSLINKILPGGQPRLLEIEKTLFGKTGVIFLPLLAEEVASNSTGTLQQQIDKALKVCETYGAQNVSLAGILPSKLNYCISSNQKKVDSKCDLKLTTGHSCTVVAVVKTIEKVIAEIKNCCCWLWLNWPGFH
jgi:hypothetical protein